MNLNRHLGWLIAAAAFAALVLPVLVYYTGTATLGPYAGGGVAQFLASFWGDILRLQLNAWVLLLGPVVLAALWRVVVSHLWPRAGS